MKKIVDTILKEEAEAKRLLDEARSAAERLIKDAHHNAVEYTAKVITGTNEALAVQHTALREQLEREKEKIISDTHARAQAARAERAGRIDTSAQQLFGFIVTIE